MEMDQQKMIVWEKILCNKRYILLVIYNIIR